MLSPLVSCHFSSHVCPAAGEAEAANGRAAELGAEVGRLTELAAKLEEDLLAADGGGGGGHERRENGIDGIVADGAVSPLLALPSQMWMPSALLHDRTRRFNQRSALHNRRFQLTWRESITLNSLHDDESVGQSANGHLANGSDTGGGGDRSMLEVLSSQRDRFRKRAQVRRTSVRSSSGDRRGVECLLVCLRQMQYWMQLSMRTTCYSSGRPQRTGLDSNSSSSMCTAICWAHTEREEDVCA